MVAVSTLDAIERERFRRALSESRYGLGRGQRPGFVPFNARPLMRKFSEEQASTRRAVALMLSRWASECGGELVEGEVLWLPDSVVDELHLDERPT